MANISTYLDNIMNAIYGEEVRSSIYNAINEMNSQLNAAVMTNLNALGFKGAASGNLDNYNKLSNRGIWVIKPSNSYSNLPSGFDKSIGGLLIIYADEVTVTPEYDDADFVKQELHYYRAGSDSDRGNMGNNVVWSRALVTGESELSSGWSDWEKADTTAAMSLEGNLQDGTNLNLLKNASDSGFYKLLSTRTYYNLPNDYINNTAGLLTVISMGTATIQELRKFSGSGENEITYWARVYASNAWSDWQKNTDTSLSIEGSAADAKAAGQAVLPYGTTVDWDNGPYTNVIALPKNKVYGFWGKTGIKLPDENEMNGVTCTLLKFSPYYHDESSEGFAVYILFAWLQNERRMYTAMSSIGATNLEWKRVTQNISIDASLSVQGSAADAKAVGDKALISKQAYLPVGENANLNNFYAQGIYSIMSPQGTQNWPFGNAWGIFVVLNANNATGSFSAYSVVQLAFCEGKYAFRTSKAGTSAPVYSDWIIYEIDNTLSISGAAADAKAVGDAISGAAENVVSSKGLAMSTDPEHPVKDLNDYKNPGIYLVGNTKVQHWAFDDNYKGILVIFNSMSNGAVVAEGIVQLAFSNDELAYRIYGAGNWGSWIKNDNSRLLNIIEGIADIESVQNEITATDNQNYYLEIRSSTNACRVKNSEGSELVLYSAPVTAKKSYRVTASNVASIDNAILAFSTYAIAPNVDCSMLIDNTGGPTIDYSYSPTQDGYLFLSKGTNDSMTYRIYEIDEETTLKDESVYPIIDAYLEEHVPTDFELIDDGEGNVTINVYTRFLDND